MILLTISNLLVLKHSIRTIFRHFYRVALKIPFTDTMMPAATAIVLAPNQILATLVRYLALRGVIQLDVYLLFVSLYHWLLIAFQLLLLIFTFLSISFSQPQ